MTNREAEFIVREIGKLRTKNKINLYYYDAWFLFGITNQIYNASVLSRGQQQYMLIILHKLKEGLYVRKSVKDKPNVSPLPA